MFFIFKYIYKIIIYTIILLFYPIWLLALQNLLQLNLNPYLAPPFSKVEKGGFYVFLIINSYSSCSIPCTIIN